MNYVAIIYGLKAETLPDAVFSPIPLDRLGEQDEQLQHFEPLAELCPNASPFPSEVMVC